jgi:4-hydroxy-3-methylbut-2-enyl diphosphate reductase
MPVYYIRGEEDMEASAITHFEYASKQEKRTSGWIPEKRPLRVVLTSGASCPDAVVENVLKKMCTLLGEEGDVKEVVHSLSTGV